MRSSTVSPSPAVKSGDRPTTTVVTGVTDKVELNSADISAGDGQLVADVTEPEKAGAKKLHWYRVTKGGFVGHDGLRARLTVGKEIHDGAYDIPKLRKQGIELESLGEGPATGPLQATG